jgi:hypothetical protein
MRASCDERLGSDVLSIGLGLGKTTPARHNTKEHVKTKALKELMRSSEH